MKLCKFVETGLSTCNSHMESFVYGHTFYKQWKRSHVIEHYLVEADMNKASVEVCGWLMGISHWGQHL